MLKFALVILAIGGIIFFTPLGNDLKAKVIDYVNPSAAQVSKLNSLHSELDKMTQTIQAPNLTASQKAEQLKTILSQAGQNLDQAQASAETKDLSATVSSILKHALPASWTAPFCKN